MQRVQRIVWCGRGAAPLVDIEAMNAGSWPELTNSLILKMVSSAVSVSSVASIVLA